MIYVKPLLYLTIALCLVTILVWPLSKVAASLVFLFTLAIWSRVPALLTPVTKDVEIVDFITVSIAFFYNPILAGIFGFLALWVSKAFGPLEYPIYTLKDSLCFLTGGMLVPFFSKLVGNSFLFTMYSFTAWRYAFYLVLTAIIEPHYLGLEIGIMIPSLFIAYASNTILSLTLESFVASLFKVGLVGIQALIFSIILLIFFIMSYVIKKKFKPREERVGPEAQIERLFRF